MDIRDWTVCIIEPNKYEAQIAVDLLRFSGVQKFRTYLDSAEGLEALKFAPANLIVMELDAQPIDALAWVRRFRRDQAISCRKSPVMVMTKKMSRAVAESCRIAGANALIGKPLSGATLMTVIKKVLANPRPFIEAENYVGPCRRAGIVTANSPVGRRKADTLTPSDLAAMAPTIDVLRKRVEEYCAGRAVRTVHCEEALNNVQEMAVSAGDGPMMRACAAFALQLTHSGKLDGGTRSAIDACMDGLAKLGGGEDCLDRDAVAENVRQAVARAASRRAA